MTELTFSGKATEEPSQTRDEVEHPDKLNFLKSQGPSSIHPTGLKELGCEIAELLTKFF